MRYEKRRTGQQVGDNADATAVVAICEAGYEDEIAILSTESLADHVIEMLQAAIGATTAAQKNAHIDRLEQALRSANHCLAEDGDGPAVLTESQIKALAEPLVDDLAALLGGDIRSLDTVMRRSSDTSDPPPSDARSATREQWMIGIVIAAIANAVNGAYCAYNKEIEAVNEDPGYIAKVAAVVADDSSTWQLESLQDVIESAIPLCAAREQPRPPVGR